MDRVEQFSNHNFSFLHSWSLYIYSFRLSRLPRIPRFDRNRKFLNRFGVLLHRAGQHLRVAHCGLLMIYQDVVRHSAHDTQRSKFFYDFEPEGRAVLSGVHIILGHRGN